MGVVRRSSGRWLTNSSRTHLARYNEEFARSTPNDALVLDAGAGSAPYRGLFAHTTYETADFEMFDKEYRPSTYVCDLTAIPVESGRFDRVVCNQVLEHVPQPLAVLKELHRVLKPNGSIICTCPLFYEEHGQPYDFYRYTQFAHRYLFEVAGFQIERLEWMEGYLGTVAYQLQCMHRFLPRRPRRLGGGVVGWLAAPLMIIVKVIAFGLAGVFYRLDLRFKTTDIGMPKNYVVIAKKAA
jgi:SAM-dependent methyltransferase